MLTADIIAYYSGLLIMQYASLGNAVGTVSALIGAYLQDQIVSKFLNAWNVVTAIGNQLTLLGSYRGAPRVVFGITPGNYWSLIPYADPLPNGYFGWALYTDATPTWKWIQYPDVNAFATTLTDSQLRRLIQFRAAISTSKQGLGDLDNILYSVFGTYVNLVDNKNMTITYQHNHLDTDPDGLWNIVVLANALPHAAGVAFNVQEY
jgi:hypothetical protein